VPGIKLNPPRSGTWYNATANSPSPRPRLAGSQKAEVCVVGAGLAGLTTALELSRHGKSVVLVEGETIASGASGRNGGFVTAGFAEDIPRLIQRVGLEQARALYVLSRAGVEYVREQIEVLDPTVQAGKGFLSVQRYADEDRCRGYVQLLRDEVGHDLEFWPAGKIREALRTERYFSAVYDPDAFHIHPLNYALALACEIERKGGVIFENSHGLNLEKSTPGFVLVTQGGRVFSRNVVLCTGAARGLSPALSRSILPISTHVVVSAPVEGGLEEIIQTSAAIADTRRAGDYYRMVDRSRLLWGGKISTRRSPPRQLVSVMKRTIAGVYPQLSSIDIEYAWSGLMAYCIHKMPLIGELEPGVWMATGFGGHGLNTTAMAGCLIASAIVEGDKRWRRFTPYGPVWSGGPIGRAGVQLGYWWMQARDYRDERVSRSTIRS